MRHERDYIRNFIKGRKLTIHRVTEHDILHDFIFRNTFQGGLFGDLFFYQLCTDKTGADNITVDVEWPPSLAIVRAKPSSPCLPPADGIW